MLGEEAERFLCQLPWPGNVRQLENTCRWLTVMAAGREISLADLPPELLQPTQHVTAGESQGDNWQKVCSPAGHA